MQVILIVLLYYCLLSWQCAVILPVNIITSILSSKALVLTLKGLSNGKLAQNSSITHTHTIVSAIFFILSFPTRQEMLNADSCRIKGFCLLSFAKTFDIWFFGTSECQCFHYTIYIINREKKHYLIFSYCLMD